MAEPDSTSISSPPCSPTSLIVHADGYPSGPFKTSQQIVLPYFYFSQLAKVFRTDSRKDAETAEAVKFMQDPQVSE